MKNILSYRYTEAGVALRPPWLETKFVLPSASRPLMEIICLTIQRVNKPSGALHWLPPSPLLSTNQSQCVEHTGLVSIKKPQNVSG